MPELLLVARRDEHLARFWQYAEKDEADAPRAMKELIAGGGPVKVTEQEAREALAWCDGRPGWIHTDHTCDRDEIRELRPCEH